MIYLIALSLLAITSANPIKAKQDFIIGKDSIPDAVLIHRTKYDVTKIVTPFNAINFAESRDGLDDKGDITIFYTQGIVKDRKIQKKGLYVLRNKVEKLLLPNGNDITYSYRHSNDSEVYFAADGMYKYNVRLNEAEAFGDFNDQITGVAFNNKTNDFYILVEGSLYSMNLQATNVTEIETTANVTKIETDFVGNLYYADINKNLYTYDGEKSVKVVTNVDKIDTLDIFKNQYLANDTVIVRINQKFYTVASNGTILDNDSKTAVEPLAISVESGVVTYYAYDKNIYEVNILVAIVEQVLKGLADKFYDKFNELVSGKNARFI